MMKFLKSIRGRIRGFLSRNNKYIELFDNLIFQNPVLTIGFGLPTIVMASVSLKTALVICVVMGITFFPVVFIMGSIPKKLPEYLFWMLCALLSAALFIPGGWLMRTYFGEAYSSTGIYLQILCVDLMIVTRAYQFRNTERKPRAVLDTITTFFGFGIVTLIVGIGREFLSAGTIGGTQVIASKLLPSLSLPFLGFFVVALLAALFRGLSNSYKKFINMKEADDDAD